MIMQSRKNIQRSGNKKSLVKDITSIFTLGLAWFCCTLLPLQASTKSLKNEQMQLEVSKGTLIKFKEPVSNVFVADAEIADIQVKSATLVYVFGKSQGETTLYGITSDDRVIYEGEISVTHNLGSLNSALKMVIPDGRIQVNSYEGLLVLTGHVKNPEQAEEARRMAEDFVGKDQTIVNRVSIATPLQVNLRVKIAEVGRDTMKQLGFNWENLFSSGSTALGIVQGANVFDVVPNPFAAVLNPLTGLLEAPAVPLPMKEFLTGGRGINSLAGGFKSGNFDINFIIDAMEEEGVLSVLAEPNLTTLSGEGASFLAGGEYPIPTIDDGQVVIEYKEFGVALNFTPVVLDDGRINMHIKPEVSQLSSTGAITLNGFNIPALNTRRAETTVELGSGQSFAVAGLLQNSVTHDLQKFPWLGDVPILGSLFRSSKFRRQETELVIIVTPYIVNPHKGGTMPLPTDNFQVPNDKDRYLKGQSYATRAPDTPPPAQGRNGQKMKSSAGFILD